MHITPDLLQRYDRPGPRYTSYPTAIEFREDFGEQDYKARLQSVARGDDDLSVYVHLPFCRQRCLYCACNVVISPHGKASEPYLSALHEEIAHVGSTLGRSRRVTQLHLGGGTPTYSAPRAISALMHHLRGFFHWDEDAELAIELDPRATTISHLEVLREEGFNRVSLGVQDFDPRVQETIGRVQPIELTRGLVTQARQMGMRSVNLDLIYGLPHQTPETFRRSLELVAEIRPERLAIYGFAYVPWIQGHQKKLPADAMPGPEERLELLALCSEILTEAGYEHIGMDHFALPDSDLCQARREGRLWRNFMGYTTARAPHMLGFGLSSIGYVDGAYVQNEKNLARYNKRLTEQSLPVARGRALTEDDKLRAHVIRELMCNLTLDRARVEAQFKVDFQDTFADALEGLAQMQAQGLVRLEGPHIHVTGLGQIFVRNIAMLFDGYLNKRNQGRPVFSRTV
jgi:oxygen-independent coproporphyrinogen-3 oxidase